MLLPGLLGFHTWLLVSLLAVFVLIRRQWMNAAARKEEVVRLLAIASEESAFAEVQAATEYFSIPKVSKVSNQCAVCFCPTTTRCAQCKAVHYCSSKCQIIHWRRGHKNECHPPTLLTNIEVGLDFDGNIEAPKHFEVRGNASKLPKLKKNSKAVPTVGGDGDLLACAERDIGLSSTSLLAGLASSGARIESVPNVSTDEALCSSSNARPEDSFSVETGSIMPGIRPSIKKTQMMSPPTDSTSSKNNEGNISKPRKSNKSKSAHQNEGVDLRSQSFSHKTGIYGAVISEKASSKKTTEIASSSETFGMDAPIEVNNPRPSSSLMPDSVTNNGSRDSELWKDKRVRPSTFGIQGFSSSKFESSLKDISSVKTSVWKAVQQFKPTKMSKPYLFRPGNEVTGNYTDKIIFPYDVFVKLYSCDGMELRPFGLRNCGNSCYANAVLQCLAFTRPLTSYLMRGFHSKACREKSSCIICELEHLILKAKEGRSPLSPIKILSRIQETGKHLGHGREEDAHEFLRYVVETMQSVCLKEVEVVDPLAEATTLVGLTFGGYLHSKIKCMECHGKSEYSERMMDLTVEIDGNIDTLEEALRQFTASELLDGDNKYQCSRCKSYEKAKKKLTVLEAPNILTIVLKRFQSGNFGKLSKSIRFPEVLNMGPYMTAKRDKPPVYSLYAVVVHLDVNNAAFSGHYICYVKNIRGEWFRIDDSNVTPVDSETVLLEGAYMLLYARNTPCAPALLRNKLNNARSKRRSMEAVPSSHNLCKSKSHSSISYVDQSTAKHKHEKHLLFDSEDWRSHSIRRFPRVDSASESSSLFSSSDASSCSTASTKDSVRAEDFSDYLFGEVQPSGYSRVASSSQSNRNSEILYTNHRQFNGRSVCNNNTDTCIDTARAEEGVWAHPYDVRSSVSLRKVSGIESAQTFY